MRRAIIHVAIFAATAALTSVISAAEPREPRISPGELESALENLEELAARTVQTNGTPGLAIAVVHRDEVVFTKCFGVREAGKPELIDANTVFQVASVSKPVTSTVLAALVGEGEIGWDDRVSDLDPSFVMYVPYVTRELRLRDLLCHRSGLPEHAGDLLEDMGYSRSEILRRLRYLPPAASFRAGYAYTNFGYSEAAYAAANKLSAQWGEIARQKLFLPLGMKSTSYQYADYERAANRAKLHVLVDGQWTAKNTRQPDAQAPAGGVSSTVSDLAQWMRLQLASGKLDGKQLIAADALRETHTPHIVTGFAPDQGKMSGYGLGWNVSDQRDGLIIVSHSGAFFLGVRTEVALIPSEKLGIIVLSNGGPNGVPEALIESFFDWAVDGKLERDWLEFANRMFAEEVASELAQTSDFSHPPAEKTAPSPPAAYVGSYDNDYFGTIHIVEDDSKLKLELGPDRRPYELEHWNRDVFSFQPTGESAGGRSGVAFSMAPDGRAESVLIEYLNVTGLGRFERSK
jgi:CubicO group peptidase (beta-lactamase class C family)